MKKLIFLSFLIFNLFNAQTHRFLYELKFKSDSTKNDITKVIMVLDINPKETKYYDYNFLEKDSINLATSSQNTSWTNQIPITRKKNSFTNMNFVTSDFNYFKYPTEDKIDWTLINETKKLFGFNAQKATTKFGGRQWIAWFTKEIPFNEGPYKFQGLPGLIIAIQDSKDQYIFNLIKIQNLPKTYDTSNILEVRYGQTPILTNEKKYISIAKKYYNDPFFKSKQGLRDGSIKSVESYGQKYKTAEELIPATKSEQQRILKRNNPIELSKAINYKN